jgi:hypothetical protein
MAWNPLRSERDMFRFLIQVGIVCVAIVLIVVLIRTIF